MHRALLVLLFLCCSTFAGATLAPAQSTRELRVATLAPSGSPLVEAYEELDQRLREQTQGRVGLRVYAGGSAGDERTVVRKMRDGQLDGAVLTTTGIGMISPRVLVLEAPGIITEYRQLDTVLRRMRRTFDRLVADEGFKVVGWGDAGRLRLFSNQEITRPAQLRTARPWVWRDSPHMVAFMRAVGANGVPLGVPEVYPGLQTRMIDTVLGSAMVAIGFQWHSRLRYMSDQASGVLVGALVIKQSALDALPEEGREMITGNARATERVFRRAGRRLERQAERALRRRMQVVDAEAHRAEWQAVADQTRESMIGRLYPRSLVERVQQIVTASNAEADERGN